MNSWKIAVLGVTRSMERNYKRLTLAYWDKAMEKESEVPLDRNSEQESGCVVVNRTRLCHSFWHGQHQLLLVPISSLTTGVKFKAQIQITSLGREGTEFRISKYILNISLAKLIQSNWIKTSVTEYFSPPKKEEVPPSEIKRFHFQLKNHFSPVLKLWRLREIKKAQSFKSWIRLKRLMLLVLLFKVQSLYQKDQLFAQFQQFCRVLVEEQQWFYT